MKHILYRVLKCLDWEYATIVIIAMGLILRVIPLVMVGGRPLVYESVGYFQTAEQLLRHEKFAATYWPPGVPYYLLLVRRIFGDGLLASRASILPIYAAFSFALYGLAREVSTRKAGNLAVLLFALYPSYVRASFDPSTEFLAAACLVASTYLLIRAIERPSSILSVALGLVLGALALTRASSLLLVILAPAYLFHRTKRGGIALATFLVSLTLIGAWLWRAYAMTGRFVMINDANAYNLYQSNNPYTPLYNTCADNPLDWEVPIGFSEMTRQINSESPCEQQRHYRQVALHHIFSRPDLFALRSVNRLRAYFCFPIHRGEPLLRYSGIALPGKWVGCGLTILDICFYWPVMILFLMFCFNFRSFSVKTEYLVAIVGVALVYAFPYWLSCSQPRYNFPVVPLFGVLSAILVVSQAESSWSDILSPAQRSIWRKRAMLLSLSFFFYIQVEWIVLVVTSKPSS